MHFLFYIILFCLLLLIVTEPLYIRVEKTKDTAVAFHFVFFSFHLIKRRTTGHKSKKKRKISFTSYIRAWVNLKKRVKIKIDALYFPLEISHFTQALLCGLFPALLQGERSYGETDTTSFALHIETTLPDCLMLYLKALKIEKNKETVW